MTFKQGIQFSFFALFIAACGGGKKAGPSTPSGGNGQLGAPNQPSGGGTKVTEISRDARASYKSAITDYKATAKSGWTKGGCESSAGRFASIADQHKLVEARYMQGLSYHNCGMTSQAKSAYENALRMSPTHARSLSNLGQIYLEEGNVARANANWNKAIDSDPKMAGAKGNQGWALLEKLRTQRPGTKAWKTTERDAKAALSASLAYDSQDARTYVIYALLYMEGYERNRSRLDIAKLLLDTGKEHNDKYAPMYNAYGLLELHKDNQAAALRQFQKAVELDPNFIEARLNFATINVSFRKYDVAANQYEEVLKRQPKNYDAVVGLGIALRGQKNLTGAQKQYESATKLDGNKGAAFYNLGVLYMDFIASRAENLQQAQNGYERAKGYFQSYLQKKDATGRGKQEAKDNIETCNKNIKQLQQAIAFQNS